MLFSDKHNLGSIDVCHVRGEVDALQELDRRSKTLPKWVKYEIDALNGTRQKDNLCPIVSLLQLSRCVYVFMILF